MTIAKPFLLLCCSLFLQIGAWAQQIDSANSYAAFEISNMRVNTVKGTIKGMSGQATFNPANLATARFEVCLQASTIDTGNKQRDRHLRNSDFFDTDNHPSICFSSTSITRQGENSYTARGTLTLLGQSKNAEIVFTAENQLLTGTLIIKRLNYGLGADTGTFLVGNEVTITIYCQLKAN